MYEASFIFGFSVGEKEESRKGSIENKNSGDKRKTKR